MSTITEVETTPQAIEELAGRIFTEGVGAFHLGTVYIGLKHGLFVALVEDGPLTAGELASAYRAGRLVRARVAAGRNDRRAAAGRRRRPGHSQLHRPHRGSARRWSTRPARHSSAVCHSRPAAASR